MVTLIGSLDLLLIPKIYRCLSYLSASRKSRHILLIQYPSLSIRIVFALIAILAFGSVSAQTTGLTYKAGLNAGNPITKRAPITEIVDFKGYNDSIASTTAGQFFEITLISGHKLLFNLSKTGNPVAAYPAPTFSNASMGAVATYKPPSPVLPALYSPSKPYQGTFNFNNIRVIKPDGTLAPSWNIIIIDAESSNKNADNIPETIVNSTNGQPWTEWDLITNTNNNPIQSGIGTSVVSWQGAASGIVGAFAAASVKPTSITSVLTGSKQGIALAIESYIGDKAIEICSGSAFDASPLVTLPASEMTYTWSQPIVSGDKGQGSLTGALPQEVPATNLTQTLINNTNSTATATYTVIPHHQSGSDLSPFTITVSVRSLTSTRIAYAESYCASGKAMVTLQGNEGGTFSSTAGLNLDPSTGEINLETSIPGQYYVTYTFSGESCVNKTGTILSIKELPRASISYAGPYCATGAASVIHTGQSGGTYSSTTGLDIHPSTGEINLGNSTPGNYTVTYTFNDGSCSSTAGTSVAINPLPVVLARASATNICAGTPITLTGSGAVTYIWEKGIKNGIPFIPQTTATYTVTGTTAEGCVDIDSITVTVIHCPPAAIDDVLLTSEETTVTGNVSTNDTDPNGDKLTFTALTQPDNGSLIFNPDGTFTFVPGKDYSGSDGFEYQVCNSRGLCEKARVNITIMPVNDSPVAVDDNYSTAEEMMISIPAPGIMANDSDADGNPITAFEVTRPANGTLKLQDDGSFIYTPNANFSGIDIFTYKVSDGTRESNIATVTITVVPVNDAPVAVNDTYKTTEETTLTIAAPGIMVNDSDRDGDPITTIQLSKTANGILNLNSDGSLTYTPNKDFYGTDVFTYKVSDGNLESDVAIVSILVTPVNDLPVATDDHFDLSGGKPITEKLIFHDPDGDPVSTTLDSKPEHGQVTINPDGSFTYTPDKGYFGNDEFFYTVCDGTGACAKAKITLTILPLAIVNLTPALSVIPEGNRIRITAVLTSPLAEDIELTLGYSGDAQKAKDYKLFENFVTIKILAGQVTTVEQVLISSLIDYINEKDEHVLVTIIDVNSSSVKIGTGADVTIQDVYPMDKEANDNHLNEDIKPDPLMSPNGDKLGNEFFKITNIDRYSNNEVIIFNRWGNEVYRISGYDNLDKSFTGVANTGLLTNTNKDLSEGVYYYIIYTTGTDNIKRLNKGYLILKR